MPRIGMNPNRGRQSDYRPSRVTLAMLTYLPNESGYFRHRFDVTRLSLESLIANTAEPCDLIVFDNGSCSRMVEYLKGLRDAGKIHYLVLSSQNVGKIAALQAIFQLAQGELVAYTDDDVFFLPGWLEEHQKILETYPHTGMVTGFYIRSHMCYAVESTLKFAGRQDVKAERGLLNDEAWERHYMESMDRSSELYAEETRGLEDVALTYNGIEAFVSAGHHQFVAPRRVMLEALPKAWSSQLMGKMIELDTQIDQMDYLRLSTRQPVTRLLGNVIDSTMAAEAQRYNLTMQSVQVKKSRGFANLFLRSGRVRVWTYRLYHKLFEILNTTER
jgi:glycosyltransferase involved in cell wall biosynthesis